MRAPVVLLRPLEGGLNRLLAMDPESPSRLRALTGRAVRVDLAGAELSVRVYFSGRGLSLSLPDAADPAADASVTLTPAAGLALLRSRGEEARGVEFQGDVAVVHALRRLIEGLEIDWEEQLSRFTGDLLAHQLGSAARGFTGWLKQSARTAEQNLGEYLTEEARQLPPRLEVRGLLDDIDRLRQDVDRAEARIQRLERGGGRS